MTEPGLAPQRTRLAWRRTLLTITVAGLLSVRLAIHYGTDAGSLLGAAAAMLVWLGAEVITHRRIRALTEPHPSQQNNAGSAGPPTAGGVVPLCATVCVGYAVLGAILVLTHLPG